MMTWLNGINLDWFLTFTFSFGPVISVYVAAQWVVIFILESGGTTNRYLRLIHRFHQPQKYRYEDEPVPMLA